MYELVDLQGLILNLIYKELDSDSKSEFNKIKDEVEQEIYRYTNYTVALITDPDYLEVKKQLKRPYAWILEYYALALNITLDELQKQRIHNNYKEAKEMLETFPKYYAQGEQEDSSNTFDIEGVVEF
jgi:hypothetical protein